MALRLELLRSPVLDGFAMPGGWVQAELDRRAALDLPEILFVVARQGGPELATFLEHSSAVEFAHEADAWVFRTSLKPGAVFRQV